MFQLLEEKDGGKNLTSRLLRIRNDAKSLVSTINKIFPEYTPHNIDHNDKVVETYSAIFPKSLLDALNKHEIFFLISASYLHDIGMSELSKLRDLDTDKINEEQRES